ncbi:2-polyprenyl-6-methoxyphenol hydroxylase-like FAD-dependent oxidoreductase [Actinoplanes lutulentus]|uniref:2-polyprenyl-6-methoxyphenol hydroxylase-like FAD-dependent oxidoreductase n=1 Tax=Actinoplanes lutulentus TaxID=1287878 RepID=A0A327ZB21_9ACTN|nr:FAD-dependent oxidoreductase [Actinoplanes lutulentus]MBB2947426.1 2-polyprenyl-6-methoxyphenol hydroxylase-like FAD-dependent oxidoreductase [Actinoplanes lutulentus]RAK36699.1 2-polyprenyl-6-methoxyphenol hydroxylase-like FAD-dependent oxidoreductase [Actinoplanes lutulentus]
MEIIGGGIGGLSAAIALARDGHKVTLRERNAALPSTGTALGMWPAALRALDELGVGDQVRRTGSRQQAGAFLRSDGSRIATIDIARLRKRTGDDVYLISRPALLAILHQAAADAGADLRFGEPVSCLDETADLLVVADGVFSRTRDRLLGPAYQARYSGSTAWRGTIEDMPTAEFAEIWGRGAKFGVTPHEGGRTNWFAAAAAPEGRFEPGHEVAALHRIFGDWAAPVRPVLDAIEESRILRHDIYVTPPLPSFVHGNAVLIGDAAHAMNPDLGRGACEAIIDAVTLAACLRQQNGPLLYDRSRRPATQRLARVAAIAARMTRMRHALPLRNGLLKASMLAGPPS